MATRRKRIENAPLLSPFPEGWYFIASRADLVKSKLIQKTWMGENIVAWCDANGGVCVAEAYCPHLGSDLGLDAGGRICDGRLVCPFHGYAFDATGQCVATPHADPPKTPKLRVFETHEALGLKSEFSIRDILPRGGTVLADMDTLEAAVGGSAEVTNVLIKAEATESRTLLNVQDRTTPSRTKPGARRQPPGRFRHRTSCCCATGPPTAGSPATSTIPSSRLSSGKPLQGCNSIRG